MRSDRLGETLLPKRIALPVFASDPLSSVAYAPDEIFLTLGLAGGALALTHSWKVALAVVVVMVVVVASYRQNVHAYPSGGGDYEVATVNLGPKFGLGVGSALLVDYMLTVAVYAILRFKALTDRSVGPEFAGKLIIGLALLSLAVDEPSAYESPELVGENWARGASGPG